MKLVNFVSLIALALSTMVSAYTIDDVDIEYWAGDSGSNESAVVISFGQDDNYAFGFKWDGSKTSYDALLAIDTAGSFEMVSHYDSGYQSYFIDSMSYAGITKNSYELSFFTSDDGLTWASSPVGVSDNTLANGDFDGWATGAWVQGESGWYFDGTVTTPVPEPITIAMLGLGALLMRKKV